MRGWALGCSTSDPAIFAVKIGDHFTRFLTWTPLYTHSTIFSCVTIHIHTLSIQRLLYHSTRALKDSRGDCCGYESRGRTKLRPSFECERRSSRRKSNSYNHSPSTSISRWTSRPNGRAPLQRSWDKFEIAVETAAPAPERKRVGSLLGALRQEQQQHSS